MKVERGLVPTDCGYIHYRAMGSGPTVMINHINQQSSALMLELMAVLSQGMRAVAIDYPGHGHSDHITEQPTIGTYAECAVQVMDALGIDTACAMGEAVGAAVTTELAGRWPERFRRALLVNCPWYSEVRDADASHEPLVSRLRPADASGFPTTRTVEFMVNEDPTHAPMAPTQSWMDRINVAQLEAGRDRWQALAALRLFAFPEKLPAIACPTLLLIGEHFHYLKFRDEFARHIPDVTIEVVPNGRFCMTWERADEIGRRALEFFGG